MRTPFPQVLLHGLHSLHVVTGHKGSGSSICSNEHSGFMHFSFSTMWNEAPIKTVSSLHDTFYHGNLPTETCGHFFLPAWSMNVLVLIDIPIPQVTEHGDISDHFVVLHTPTPSPASSTLASLLAKFSSGSSMWFLYLRRMESIESDLVTRKLCEALTRIRAHRLRTFPYWPIVDCTETQSLKRDFYTVDYACGFLCRK